MRASNLKGVPRRFPAPWTTPGGCKVLDASGQALAYVYARDSAAEANTANVLTTDEARRIATLSENP